MNQFHLKKKIVVKKKKINKIININFHIVKKKKKKASRWRKLIFIGKKKKN